MDMPMLTLGMFVFALDTLPYQQLQRDMEWRLASNPRVGRRPAYQYTGPGEDTITLSGVLLPELTGGDMSLAMVKLMAEQGKAWPLIEGTGMVYGWYAIEKLSEGRTEFFSDGKARRIDFTLTLKRVDDDSMVDTIGAITRSIMELVL